MSSLRVPRLALLAWATAAAIVAVLVVAVTHFLSHTGAHGMTGMAGMPAMGGMHAAGTSTADALTRGGAPATSEPLFGSAFFTAWQLDAIALAVLVALAAAYLTGVALVARRGGPRWPRWHTASFLAGLAAIAFATCGSVAVYDQVLFTAHMVGHLLLVMVGPALLMYGRPLGLLVAASRRRERIGAVLGGRVVSLLSAPPVVLAGYAAVIVGSHLTGLMDTVMLHTWAGQVEHLVYVVAGCLFFVVVVGDEPIRWRLSSPARWLLLAIAMAVDTFVGIVLMQQTAPISMMRSALAVDELSDTHTGGAIMWFGGDAVMAVIMIALVVTWLRRAERAPAELGWLEQARMATFSTHTGTADSGRGAQAATGPGTAARGSGAAGESIDSDTDDAAREAYNDWLAKLAGRR